jgi:hypothetical protein
MVRPLKHSIVNAMSSGWIKGSSYDIIVVSHASTTVVPQSKYVEMFSASLFSRQRKNSIAKSEVDLTNHGHSTDTGGLCVPKNETRRYL